MTLSEFITSLSAIKHPVILLEGRRSIDSASAAIATKVGALLAQSLPHAIFRSGNAKGSDEAFSKGVASIDPQRLEIVAPKANHRAGSRLEGAQYLALSDIGDERETLIEPSISATPRNKTLFRESRLPPAVKAKADYLLRDTLKVLGAKALRPADAALFYIDPADPMAGGTGHTIRVCQSQDIPILYQSTWADWA